MNHYIITQWLYGGDDIRGSSKSLHDYLTYGVVFKNLDEFFKFIEIDLIPILLQVYIPLAMLGEQFTHYDLHLGNIQIMKSPFQPTHIEYIYNYKGKDIKFKSKYIVKIIDYARSYFFRDKSINSLSIYQAISNYIKTNSLGQGLTENQIFVNNGFRWLGDNAVPLHMSCRTPNMTYDLLALYNAMKQINHIIVNHIIGIELTNYETIIETIIDKLPYIKKKGYDFSELPFFLDDHTEEYPVDNMIYTIFDCVDVLAFILNEYVTGPDTEYTKYYNNSLGDGTLTTKKYFTEGMKMEMNMEFKRNIYKQ